MVVRAFSNHSPVSHLWNTSALHLDSAPPSAGTGDVKRTWRVNVLDICSATAAWQLSGSSVEGLPSTTARAHLDGWERNLLPFGMEQSGTIHCLMCLPYLGRLTSSTPNLIGCGLVHTAASLVVDVAVPFQNNRSTKQKALPKEEHGTGVDITIQ